MAPQRSKSFRINPRFKSAYARLDAATLASSDTDQLDEDDVALNTTHRQHLAFGQYSRLGLEKALRAYGFFEQMATRGMGPVSTELSLEDPFRPRLVLMSDTHRQPVVDLTLSSLPAESLGLQVKAAVLYLEAIALQHPGQRFSWSRPPLPGQVYPGLSLLSEVLQLLLLMAQRIGAEGVALTPSSFHAAWIYERYFRFVSPADQGQFQALRSAGRLRPLWVLAWAVSLGCVNGPDGDYRYQPLPMLCPLSARLESVLIAPEYAARVKETATTRFRIDWKRLRERFPWEEMPPGQPSDNVSQLVGRRPKGR